MKRSISVSVHIGKCWKVTTNQLKLVRSAFIMRYRGEELPGEYDEYAIAIVNFFRVTERMIESKNKFDRFEYEAELKKLIQGIKNKYNIKN